ncbi:MAG: hypothetical protein AAF560_10500 [Acidobacteriota bacterium]
MRDAEDEAAPEVRPQGRRELTVRLIVIVACLLGAIGALAQMVHWRSLRSELQSVVQGGAESNEEAQELSQRIALERTGHHAQLIVARALVYDAMIGGENLAGGLEASVEQLKEARSLAVDVLRQHPNSWEASMFLGAATYLEWSFQTDRRLYSEAKSWELPLLEAIEAAPGKREPRRFLVTAYLETWEALSPAKRDAAFELVRTTFQRDLDAFIGLASVWIEVAGDRALEVMPDQPRVWKALEAVYARANDWETFGLAHSRHLDALEQQLSRELDEAEDRLRLGDLRSSRDMCLRVLAAAPRDGRFAPLAIRALEMYAPGLHGLMSTQELKEWLDWALELSTISIVPFSPRVMGRLTDSIGELDAATGALAALIGEDTYRTDRYEKLEERKRSEPWGRFLIAKSRWLVERDEVAAADRALDDVHRAFHTTVGYWLARQRVARAAADLRGLAEANERLADLQRLEWDATEWRPKGKRHVVELYPEPLPRAASTLSLELQAEPGTGAVAAVVWDGREVAHRTVRGRTVVEVELEIDPKPHLLEVRPLAGARITPGRIWIS